MDTGAAGVAGFVQRKTQSNGHPHSFQTNGPGEQDTEQQSVKSRPANDKRRREAQFARVPTPRPGLTAENLNAHRDGGNKNEEAQSTDASDLPAQETAIAHSLFGTDSGHADDTTILSIVHTNDHQTELAKSHAVTYANDLEHDTGAASGNIIREAPSFDAALLDPQGLPKNLPLHYQDPGPKEMGVFGNGASYPPTTAGDTDIDVFSHISGDAGFVDLDGQPATTSQKWRRDPAPLNRTFQNGHHVARTQQRAHPSKPLTALIPSDSQIHVHDGLSMRSDRRKTLNNTSTAPLRVTLQQKETLSVGGAAPLHALYPPPQNPTHNQASHLESTHPRRGHSHEPLNDGSEGDDQLDIDYDEGELMAMPYEALLRESQDHVPRPKAFDLPNAIASAPLSKKLGHVKGLEREDQSAFFAALDQHAWEEAGDWFLDQFGAVITAFRDARKEKRRLAAEVEAKIHDRHSAIETKKRSIDEALADMRSNGATVLSSTPQRKKRG